MLFNFIFVMGFFQMVDKKFLKRNPSNSFVWLVLIVAIGIVLFFLLMPPQQSEIARYSTAYSKTGLSGLQVINADPGNFLDYRDADFNFSLKYPFSYFAIKSKNSSYAQVSFSIPDADEGLAVDVYALEKGAFSSDSESFNESVFGISGEPVQKKNLTIGNMNVAYSRFKIVKSFDNNSVSYLVSAFYSCPNYDFLLNGYIPTRMIDEEETVNYMIESFACN